MQNEEALLLIAQELELAGEDPEVLERRRRLQARRIDEHTNIPERKFLFQLFGTPCFPKGELVALTGKEKSGKTFVSSILMTLCVKKEVLDMVRLGEEYLRVLWFDTEQSEESTQEILTNRIMPMTEVDDFPSDQFFVFNVRAESWQERLPLLEQAITDCKPDLVILDGIRDLVDDINDGKLAQAVLERLMHLASSCSCCIVCVLHQNKSSEDKNLRGWIGTELTYKSFEVYECTKGLDKVFSLAQTRTRKFDIWKKMYYVAGEDGLPEPYTGTLPGTEPNGGLNPEYSTSSGYIKYEKAFDYLLPAQTRLRATQLQAYFLGLVGMKSVKRYDYFLSKALETHLVRRTEISPSLVVYEREAGLDQWKQKQTSFSFAP